MSEFFTDYATAEAAARRKAIEFRRDIGLERTNEYGTAGFGIFLLPRPEKRSGHELRAQVVALTEAVALELPKAQALATSLAREYEMATYANRTTINKELDRAQAWIATIRRAQASLRENVRVTLLPEVDPDPR
jgi:hypothetical protein